MAVITWGGLSGSWLMPADWLGGVAPGSADTALFQAGGSSTAELDGMASAAGITLATGSGVELLVDGALRLTGTLELEGGTLCLAPGGTISGGTVDLRGAAAGGGVFLGTGGVADGVVWLGPLGRGLAITPATATLSQRAAGPLALAGTVTLDAGVYTGIQVEAQTYVSGAGEIDVAQGGVVTLDVATLISARADDPNADAGVAPAYAGLVLGGAGTIVSQGQIDADLSAVYAPLLISAADFQNEGVISLAPASVADVQATYKVTLGGRSPVPLTLTYTETLPPTLVLCSPQFANSGLIEGAAATLIVQGAQFTNTGTIDLTGALAQVPVANAQTAYLASVTLGSSIDVTASVATFANTGIIAADTIEFDDDMTLAQLGAVRGTLVFTGTFDLQGGTLDLAQLDPGQSVAFTGTVRDGTLIADSGTLLTAGATLHDVTILQHPTGTLENVAAGSVVLDAATTDLDYTSAASVTSLSVSAGAAGTVDRIGLLGGADVTFGAATTIAETVPGAVLGVVGPGTLVEDGQVLLSGPVAMQVATLDGTGTITLVDGATLAVAAMAASSAVHVAFAGGSNLLVLPPSGASGVNLIGLSLAGVEPGDVIDFAGVSSTPVLGAPFGTGGAALSGGMLDVQGASGEQARLPLSGNVGLTFSVGPDATGGTLVTVACFRHGTRIATPAGDSAVEHLRIGDAVLTRDGAARRVKWLGRRRYPARLVARQRQLRPVRIAAGALGPGRPRRALFLSALHGVLLPAPDGSEALVPAGALVGCAGIRRAAPVAVAYVHVELDTPGILIAEGALVESFVDRTSRALFDNAAEYAALYPDPPLPAPAPAPLVEDGWRLHAIRGALPGGGRGVTARGRHLRWTIDHAGAGRIEGWALDEDAPDAPVALALIDSGRRQGCYLANRYRVDLDHAGVGHGTCGFVIAPAAGLSPGAHLRTLDGRRLDGRTLQHS